MRYSRFWTRQWFLSALCFCQVLVWNHVEAPAEAFPASFGGDSQITLGLRYVVYRDGQGRSILSRKEAESVLERINEIWNQCEIRFQIDEFLEVHPDHHSLKFQTTHYSELTQIRRRFSNDRSLLVVSTGPWDRSGSLGTTRANAWTTLPGSVPYGVVLENPVKRNSNLIAHELGHYLNLHHVSDSKALMNPVIFSESERVSKNQCKTARSAAIYFWSDQIRSLG